MSLTLTVLGCGGTYAGPDNACTGYLVDDGTTTIWIDTGPGTVANAQRHVELTDVDAIVLTHEHPDHWLDFPVLRNVYKYVLFHDRPVPVYGTASTRLMAESLLSDGLAPTFEWTDIDERSIVDVGGMHLRFSRTDHPVETLAVHVDAGDRSLIFSADTGPDWSAAAFEAAPDALLCEATLAPEMEGMGPHVSGAEAGAMAAEIDAGQLLLTHLLPGTQPDRRLAEATAEYDGPTTVVEVNRRYQL